MTLWKSHPNDPDVLQALGLVEKRMGRFGEAEERFSRWAQLEPDSAAALNNLGNLYLVTNRVDQAMATYLQAIRLAPSRSEAFFNLGQAYLMKLRLREAEAEFVITSYSIHYTKLYEKKKHIAASFPSPVRIPPRLLSSAVSSDTPAPN